MVKYTAVFTFEKTNNMSRGKNEKRTRFENVASRRVQKVLDDMDSLSKCANRATYEYSDADVKKMMKAIGDQYNILKAAFEAGSKTGKQTFEF